MSEFRGPYRWTPGPWQRSGRLGHAEWITAQLGASLAQIAMVYGPGLTPASVANADLIAAAPDLYRELASTTCHLCTYRLGQERSGPGCPACQPGREALAKACGEEVRHA